ncbi:hypothetical protein MAP00_007840 [Monascus purpureus]|nr:hypothetical protein MAP00_007840 [Monascus purpureus]
MTQTRECEENGFHGLDLRVQPPLVSGLHVQNNAHCPTSIRKGPLIKLIRGTKRGGKDAQDRKPSSCLVRRFVAIYLAIEWASILEEALKIPSPDYERSEESERFIRQAVSRQPSSKQEAQKAVFRKPTENAVSSSTSLRKIPSPIDAL